MSYDYYSASLGRRSRASTSRWSSGIGSSHTYGNTSSPLSSTSFYLPPRTPIPSSPSLSHHSSRPSTSQYSSGSTLPMSSAMSKRDSIIRTLVRSSHDLENHHFLSNDSVSMITGSNYYHSSPRITPLSQTVSKPKRFSRSHTSDLATSSSLSSSSNPFRACSPVFSMRDTSYRDPYRPIVIERPSFTNYVPLPKEERSKALPRPIRRDRPLVKFQEKEDFNPHKVRHLLDAWSKAEVLEEEGAGEDGVGNNKRDSVRSNDSGIGSYRSSFLRRSRKKSGDVNSESNQTTSESNRNVSEGNESNAELILKAHTPSLDEGVHLDADDGFRTPTPLTSPLGFQDDLTELNDDNKAEHNEVSDNTDTLSESTVTEESVRTQRRVRINSEKYVEYSGDKAKTTDEDNNNECPQNLYDRRNSNSKRVRVASIVSLDSDIKSSAIDPSTERVEINTPDKTTVQNRSRWSIDAIDKKLGTPTEPKLISDKAKPSFLVGRKSSEDNQVESSRRESIICRQKTQTTSQIIAGATTKTTSQSDGIPVKSSGELGSELNSQTSDLLPPENLPAGTEVVKKKKVKKLVDGEVKKVKVKKVKVPTENNLETESPMTVVTDKPETKPVTTGEDLNKKSEPSTIVHVTDDAKNKKQTDFSVAKIINEPQSTSVSKTIIPTTESASTITSKDVLRIKDAANSKQDKHELTEVNAVTMRNAATFSAKPSFIPLSPVKDQSVADRWKSKVPTFPPKTVGGLGKEKHEINFKTAVFEKKLNPTINTGVVKSPLVKDTLASLSEKKEKIPDSKLDEGSKTTSKIKTTNEFEDKEKSLGEDKKLLTQSITARPKDKFSTQDKSKEKPTTQEKVSEVKGDGKKINEMSSTESSTAKTILSNDDNKMVSNRKDKVENDVPLSTSLTVSEQKSKNDEREDNSQKSLNWKTKNILSKGKTESPLNKNSEVVAEENKQKIPPIPKPKENETANKQQLSSISLKGNTVLEQTNVKLDSEHSKSKLTKSPKNETTNMKSVTPLPTSEAKSDTDKSINQVNPESTKNTVQVSDKTNNEAPVLSETLKVRKLKAKRITIDCSSPVVNTEILESDNSKSKPKFSKEENLLSQTGKKASAETIPEKGPDDKTSESKLSGITNLEKESPPEKELKPEKSEFKDAKSAIQYKKHDITPNESEKLDVQQTQKISKDKLTKGLTVNDRNYVSPDNKQIQDSSISKPKKFPKVSTSLEKQIQDISISKLKNPPEVSTLPEKQTRDVILEDRLNLNKDITSPTEKQMPDISSSEPRNLSKLLNPPNEKQVQDISTNESESLNKNATTADKKPIKDISTSESESLNKIATLVDKKPIQNIFIKKSHNIDKHPTSSNEKKIQDSSLSQSQDLHKTPTIQKEKLIKDTSVNHAQSIPKDSISSHETRNKDISVNVAQIIPKDSISSNETRNKDISVGVTQNIPKSSISNRENEVKGLVSKSEKLQNEKQIVEELKNSNDLVNQEPVEVKSSPTTSIETQIIDKLNSRLVISKPIPHQSPLKIEQKEKGESNKLQKSASADSSPFNRNEHMQTAVDSNKLRRSSTSERSKLIKLNSNDAVKKFNSNELRPKIDVLKIQSELSEKIITLHSDVKVEVKTGKIGSNQIKRSTTENLSDSCEKPNLLQKSSSMDGSFLRNTTLNDRTITDLKPILLAGINKTVSTDQADSKIDNQKEITIIANKIQKSTTGEYIASKTTGIQNVLQKSSSAGCIISQKKFEIPQNQLPQWSQKPPLPTPLSKEVQSPSVIKPAVLTAQNTQPQKDTTASTPFVDQAKSKLGNQTEVTTTMNKIQKSTTGECIAPKTTDIRNVLQKSSSAGCAIGQRKFEVPQSNPPQWLQKPPLPAPLSKEVQSPSVTKTGVLATQTTQAQKDSTVSTPCAEQAESKLKNQKEITTIINKIQRSTTGEFIAPKTTGIRNVLQKSSSAGCATDQKDFEIPLIPLKPPRSPKPPLPAPLSKGVQSPSAIKTGVLATQNTQSQKDTSSTALNENKNVNVDVSNKDNFKKSSIDPDEKVMDPGKTKQLRENTSQSISKSDCSTNQGKENIEHNFQETQKVDENVPSQPILTKSTKPTSLREEIIVEKVDATNLTNTTPTDPEVIKRLSVTHLTLEEHAVSQRVSSTHHIESSELLKNKAENLEIRTSVQITNIPSIDNQLEIDNVLNIEGKTNKCKIKKEKKDKTDDGEKPKKKKKKKVPVLTEVPDTGSPSTVTAVAGDNCPSDTANAVPCRLNREPKSPDRLHEGPDSKNKTAASQPQIPPTNGESNRSRPLSQDLDVLWGDYNTNNNSGKITENQTFHLDSPAVIGKEFSFSKRYTIEDFNLLKVLGRGSYGKVMLAELKGFNQYFAVKCMKKDVVLQDNDVECTMIEREVLAMGSNHPYLCTLFFTFQNQSHLFFVMEYLSGGDLMFHIQQCGKFDQDRARFYAAEIVCALKYLHRHGIIYRDAKLDNICIDAEGHVRLVDFGFCKLRIYRKECLPRNLCGTPDYMAPEIIKGNHYNQSVDWWSFGVLLYEMLIGQSPFNGNDEEELFWSVCNEEAHFPRYLSQEATELMTLLLDKNPETRLGMPGCTNGDILFQPFFHPIDWKKVEGKELEPPFKPKLKFETDVSNFDSDFTMEKAALTPTDRGILDALNQTPFTGFTYTNPTIFEWNKL